MRNERSGHRAIRAWLAAQPWSAFGTLTFSLPASPASARRQLQRWLDRVQPSRAVWLTERGGVNGTLHAHAVLKWTQPVDLEAVAAAWPCGRRRVEPYDTERDGVGYIARGIEGRALTDWDVWAP